LLALSATYTVPEFGDTTASKGPLPAGRAMGLMDAGTRRVPALVPDTVGLAKAGALAEATITLPNPRQSTARIRGDPRHDEVLCLRAWPEMVCSLVTERCSLSISGGASFDAPLLTMCCNIYNRSFT
jgi:hypothetical protein